MPKFTVYLIKEDFLHIPRYVEKNNQIHENRNSIFNENVYLQSEINIENYIIQKKETPKPIIKANSIFHVYFRTSFNDKIWWVLFWQLKEKLNIQSADALVILMVENRIFAITHGHSSHLINPYATEYDFGLKTAVNLVDEDEVKCADLFTPSEIGLRTQKQTGKSANFVEFEVNIYNTLLKKIAGNIKGKYNDYFKNIDGADSIKFSFSESIVELKDILKDFINIYKSKKYLNTGFDWIDNFRPIKDKTILDQLRKKLVDSINEYDENVIFNFPTIFDDTKDIYYRFKRISHKISKKQYDNFEIEKTYYKFLKDENIIINEEMLSKHQLHAIDYETNTTIIQYPIYFCLLFETELKDDYYILESGIWYRVDKVFKKNIDDSINELLTKTWDMGIAYNQNRISAAARKMKKSKEYIFNDELTASFNKNHIAEIMDSPENIISYNKNKIELCDVLVKKNDSFYLIHTKYKYGSSALSHLFSQGNVSAELLVENNFRIAANKKIEKSDLHFPEDDSFLRKNYTIIYAIISRKNSRGEFSIPLFSKINLRIFVRNLIEKLNFNVKISFILHE